MALLLSIAHVGPDYGADLAKWRAEREDSLKKDGGWLTVAGLPWLKEGENSLGSAHSDVPLPRRSPASAGVLTLKGKKVHLKLNAGVDGTVAGKPFTEGDLKSDDEGKPDLVRIGDVSFKIIQRGKRTGVRLYDPQAQTRVTFKGLHWFEPNDKFVVKAKFVAYAKVKKIPITNILGDTEQADVPGYAEFSIRGKTFRLEAQDEGDVLFYNFTDLTTGKETYPAGRFLYSDKPTNGEVILDFNRATCPPCAYTAYATCPLPPKSNTLNVAIPAGEKNYHHS